MNYDVEADWQLLNTCNYRCGYCFFPADTLGEKLKAAGTSEEWATAFGRTGLTWLLHITGGEPSIYPHFADLCERITREHFISLNSNMNSSGMGRVFGEGQPEASQLYQRRSPCEGTRTKAGQRRISEKRRCSSPEGFSGVCLTSRNAGCACKIQ